MQPLRYPLYLFGKWVALAAIFFGGGVLAACITPILTIFPGDRCERTQFLIHKLFKFYLRCLERFHLISLTLEGAEQLQNAEGMIVIANHPSLLDVVILMAIIPRAQCIVKHQFWNHRFLGPLMRNAEYIRNDLDPETLLKACGAAVKDRRSLIIFPEGTRTVPGQLPKFQRGFANVAILTESPIQTVIVHCDRPFLFKGESLWAVPPKKPNFRVVVGEYLDASSYLLYGQRGIAARKLVKDLEVYYANSLSPGSA